MAQTAPCNLKQNTGSNSSCSSQHKQVEKRVTVLTGLLQGDVRENVANVEIIKSVPLVKRIMTALVLGLNKSKTTELTIDF